MKPFRRCLLKQSQTFYLVIFTTKTIMTKGDDRLLSRVNGKGRWRGRRNLSQEGGSLIIERWVYIVGELVCKSLLQIDIADALMLLLKVVTKAILPARPSEFSFCQINTYWRFLFNSGFIQCVKVSTKGEVQKYILEILIFIKLIRLIIGNLTF